MYSRKLFMHDVSEIPEHNYMFLIGCNGIENNHTFSRAREPRTHC